MRAKCGLMTIGKDVQATGISYGLVGGKKRKFRELKGEAMKTQKKQGV